MPRLFRNEALSHLCGKDFASRAFRTVSMKNCSRWVINASCLILTEDLLCIDKRWAYKVVQWALWVVVSGGGSSFLVAI